MTKDFYIKVLKKRVKCQSFVIDTLVRMIYRRDLAIDGLKDEIERLGG